MQENIHFMFTYGTLMQGQRNHYYLQGSEYIGDGSIKGYMLLEIDDYPGAVVSSDLYETVLGEVYKVNDEVKKKIDILEEGYLYKEIMVDLQDKQCLCGFYEFIEKENHSYPKSAIFGKWKSSEKRRF